MTTEQLNEGYEVAVKIRDAKEKIERAKNQRDGDVKVKYCVVKREDFEIVFAVIESLNEKALKELEQQFEKV